MSVEEILLDEATRVATSLEGGLAILEVSFWPLSEAKSKQRRSFAHSGDGDHSFRRIATTRYDRSRPV
jgi:hypothetical protein